MIRLCSIYGGDRYLKTGKTITDEELEGLKKFDAIFLGAIGHPECETRNS